MKNIFYHKNNVLADLIPVRAYSFLTGVKLLSVFYHTVSDNTLPHIDCLYKVRSTKEFESDMDFLLKYFQPVTLQSLIKVVNEKIPLQKPSFFLSFDDGLREFHDVAAPILLRKGIPATCFLNAAFIDNKDIFFRYKASILLNELKENKSSLLTLFNNWFESKGQNPPFPEEFLLNIDYPQRHLTDELERVLGYSFDKYLTTQKPYLTSIQIESLIQKGFTFGSHSIDHPDFRNISADDQILQVVKSTKEISQRFSLDYNVFSFPFTDFGIGRDFFEKINKSVNFDLTFGCAGIKKDVRINHIQRIPLEEYNIDARKRIKRDYLYYILKALINKNTINRK